MTWVAVGVGAVTLVGGMVQGNQASKKQKGAMNDQMAMQQADLDFRMRQYEEEKAFTDPLRNQLREQALADGPLDYGPMRDQISQQYGMAQRNMTAAMAQRGLSGSGVDAGATRGMLLSQAGDLSRAYNQGLINKRGLAMSLVARDNRMQAGAALGQGYQNMAGLHGQNAAAYGQAAQAGYSAAANGMMNGLMAYGMSRGGGGSTIANNTFDPEPLQQITPANNNLTLAQGPTPGLQNTSGIGWGW